ncbi:MAG: DUF305 domain-containing protein [Coriobacteriia bacterium]|nr:DUF305 domain-containing protein [Coriobacteriia bacterium]
MKQTTGIILAIALILIGLVGLALTWSLTADPVGSFTCPGGEPCFGERGRLGSDTADNATRPDANGSDAMFIVGMIPHHDDAIEMAELALTEAEHPEIKQLAEDIIRTQTAQNVQMRKWYSEWYGGDVPDEGDGSFGMMGGGGMMGGSFDAAQLEGADPFDKAFIEQMVPHHQMGIMMAQMAGGSTNRSEIRGLADDIITGQSAEIELMRGWYDEWYGN